jgi:hypothetical protein
MTCGQRANRRTHHHQGDPVVMMRVVVKLTLKVGDVAYPWFLGDVQNAALGSVPHWLSRYYVISDTGPGTGRSGWRCWARRAAATGTALRSLHAIDLHRTGFPSISVLRTGFFLTTASHELLQPWIYPSGNGATRLTFSIYKAARRITTAFTAKERTPTTISI